MRGNDIKLIIKKGKNIKIRGINKDVKDSSFSITQTKILIIRLI